MKKIIKIFFGIIFCIIFMGGCSLLPHINPTPGPSPTPSNIACSVIAPSDVVVEETKVTNLSTSENIIQNVSDSTVQFTSCYNINNQDVLSYSSGFILKRVEETNTYTYYLNTSYSGIFYRYYDSVSQSSKVSLDGQFEILFEDGHRYTPTLVGTCDKLDVAIFKFQSTNLYEPVSIGDSFDLTIGDDVYAIGTPVEGYNLLNTVIKGNISGLDRSFDLYFENTSSLIRYYERTYSLPTFQFDASLNGGMEGGPVFNEEGKVIGVSAYRYGILNGDASYESLAFAIGINEYMHVANSIIETGSYSKPVIGITVSEIYNVSNNTGNEWIINNHIYRGVYITEDGVDAESVAGNAGLKDKEIIIKIENDGVTYNVTNISTLTTALFLLDPSKPAVFTTVNSLNQESTYTLEFNNEH